MPQDDENLMVPQLRYTHPDIRDADRLLHAPLTPNEEQRLRTHERTIEAGLAQFLAVGRALAAIKRENLYRAQFDSFEHYLDRRWDISPRRAYQLISAAETARRVVVTIESTAEQTTSEPLVHTQVLAPVNERQVRPLVGLSHADQPVAWQRAVERSHGAQPSARVVQAVVSEMTGKEKAGSRPMFALNVHAHGPVALADAVWASLPVKIRRKFATRIRQLDRGLTVLD
jgi:hypothetical protein